MEEIKKDWSDIFRSFRMAFDPKKLFLAFAGIIISVLFIMVVAGICQRLGFISVSPKLIIAGAFFASNLCPYEMLLIFCKSMMAFSAGKLIVMVSIVMGLLVIWSIIGGAITRISAVEYAKDESLKMLDGVKFSLKKFWSYFWSPIVPAIGVVFFALCNVLIGFVGKLGAFGDIFLAFGFPLTLISSFMVAFVGIIGIIGLCLMFPTISAEGSDAFDAMSRAYSYVLSKPRRFFTYFFISSLYGIFCVVLVGASACFIVNIAFDTVGIGMGQKFKDIIAAVNIKPDYCSIISASASDFKAGLAGIDNWAERFVALSIVLCLMVVKTGVFGFALAYIGSAKTIVYFLLRKDVDETDISDIYVEDEGPDELEDAKAQGNGDNEEGEDGAEGVS